MHLSSAPPVTPRHPVVDHYHGETIVDEYRWLEHPGAETEAWERAQNARARECLEALPERRHFLERLHQLSDYERRTPPIQRGESRFFTYQDLRSTQWVLMVSEGADAPARVLLDPKTLDEAGATAIDYWVPSPEGAYVAVGLSRNDSEMSELRVLEVKTGRWLAERIPGCRFGVIAWRPDQTGFYYPRLPEAEASRAHLHHHTLGADWRSDPQVYAHPGDPSVLVFPLLSPDGRYLLVSQGAMGRNELLLRDLQDDRGFRRLPGEAEAFYDPAFAGGTLYAVTNAQAARHRLVALDLAAPEAGWREVLPEAEDALDGFCLTRDGLIAHYLHDAHSRLAAFGRDGTPRGDILLPDLGTVQQLEGGSDQERAFFTFTSFLMPARTYCASGPGEPSLIFAPRTPFRPEDFETRQVWYASKDGTRVPMFLVHRKGLALDGERPTLLSGYGGFRLSYTPRYVSWYHAWVEAGGVFAWPSLRGGGEFGTAWHHAGRLERKQRVFDDMIAAAEFLIAEGVTQPARLAVEGRSNGGLLMGAVLTQRPDLFKAVSCGTALLDMLRYHRFLIGSLWSQEYGTSDDPAQFQFLKQYSPYHCVEAGTPYPAVLLLTGAEDGRVDPLHIRKMTARLQEAQGGDAPILMFIEPGAGHGATLALEKRLASAADMLGFLAWQVRGLDLPA